MNSCDKKQLEITAAKVRLGIIEGVYNAKSGHPGGSLSAADIFTYLYFKEMRVDPANPKCPDRDRFVLSKGHCAPGLYAALAERGYFSAEELKSLRHIGAMLQGHPDMKGTPGVDMSSGSLGQGVSFMEDQVSWHGTAPNKEQYDVAMQELTAALQELEGC